MTCIAIVGGTAALARTLKSFLQLDNEVITLGRRGCDVRCDLLGPVEDIQIPLGADVVVHVAAFFGGSTDVQQLQAVETNVLGTLKVCMAARRAGVRHIVIISSLSAQLTVSSPYYGIYAITKRQAEEVAINYCRCHGLLLTVLRPSQLYAENGAYWRHQPLIYLMADCAEKGEDIILYGQHDALRNYIHADDVAKIIGRVLETGCSGVYPCTFPQDVELSEVARAALGAFARGGKVVFTPDMPDIPDNVFGNSTELYDQIGFCPVIDVWEGMRRVAHFRKEEV